MTLIGIIGAMEEEIKDLLEMMEVETITEKAGLTFYRGKLSDKDCVVVRSGIGKVNAAICTQLLIDLFAVTAVINTGIAGGIHQGIDIGVLDIVISSDTMEYDFDVTAFGYQKGQIPRMDQYIFRSDPRLVEVAQQAGRQLADIKLFVGRILSGDQFVSDSAKVAELYQDFQGYGVEMEGAAISHVCHVNEIPVVVIRAISDNADGQAKITYEEFEILAAKNSAQLVSNMMRLM